MKRYSILFLLMVFAISFNACTEESEDPTLSEYERIEGTWIIESQSLLGADVPGDGSTLTFNFCGMDTPCDGVDYLASDETSGTFSFQFNTDKSGIIFEDNDSDAGGNYNGEWTIDEFSSDRLVISVDTGIFGVTVLTLRKS